MEAIRCCREMAVTTTMMLFTLIFGALGLENRCLTAEEQGVHHLIIPGNWRREEGSEPRTVQVHVFLHGSLSKNSTKIKGFMFMGKPAMGSGAYLSFMHLLYVCPPCASCFLCLDSLEPDFGSRS